MQQVPGHVLHHGRVSREDVLGIDDSILSRRSVDIPQADGVVVTKITTNLIRNSSGEETYAFLICMLSRHVC